MFVSALKSIVYSPYRAVRFVARTVAHRFTTVRHASSRAQTEAGGLVSASASSTSPVNPLQHRTITTTSSQPASTLAQRLAAASIKGSTATRQQIYQATAYRTFAAKSSNVIHRLQQKLLKVNVNVLSSISEISLNSNQGLTKEESEQLSLLAVVLKKIAKHLPEYEEQAQKFLTTNFLGMELKYWLNDNKHKKHFIKHHQNWSRYAPLARDLCNVRLPEVMNFIQEVKSQLEVEPSQQSIKENLLEISISSTYQGLMRRSLSELSHRGFTTDECLMLAQISKYLQSDLRLSNDLKKEIKKLLKLKIFGTKLRDWAVIDIKNSSYSGLLDSGSLVAPVTEGHSYYYFCNFVKPQIQIIFNMLYENRGTLV